MASVTDTSYWIRPYDDESYHQFEVEWSVSGVAVSSRQELEILNHSAFSIYPNPVKDALYVRIMDDQIDEARLNFLILRGDIFRAP